MRLTTSSPAPSIATQTAGILPTRRPHSAFHFSDCSRNSPDSGESRQNSMKPSRACTANHRDTTYFDHSETQLNPVGNLCLESGYFWRVVESHTHPGPTKAPVSCGGRSGGPVGVRGPARPARPGVRASPLRDVLTGTGSHTARDSSDRSSLPQAAPRLAPGTALDDDAAGRDGPGRLPSEDRRARPRDRRPVSATARFEAPASGTPDPSRLSEEGQESARLGAFPDDDLATSARCRARLTVGCREHLARWRRPSHARGKPIRRHRRRPAHEFPGRNAAGRL